MGEKAKYHGFGFNPAESEYHFLVEITESIEEPVKIFERLKWTATRLQTVYVKRDKLKVELPRAKWEAIAEALRGEFNRRLKKLSLPQGNFKVGQNPVERLLGKEMVLLAWAIEDSDPGLITVAIKNWFGLSPEERWWLFTMTNAATGGAKDNKGWRKAIRYALTENPIDDKALDLARIELDGLVPGRGKKGKKKVVDSSQLGLF